MLKQLTLASVLLLSILAYTDVHAASATSTIKIAFRDGAGEKVWMIPDFTQIHFSPKLPASWEYIRPSVSDGVLKITDTPGTVINIVIEANTPTQYKSSITIPVTVGVDETRTLVMKTVPLSTASPKQSVTVLNLHVVDKNGAPVDLNAGDMRPYSYPKQFWPMTSTSWSKVGEGRYKISLTAPEGLDMTFGWLIRKDGYWPAFYVIQFKTPATYDLNYVLQPDIKLPKGQGYVVMSMKLGKDLPTPEITTSPNPYSQAYYKLAPGEDNFVMRYAEQQPIKVRMVYHVSDTEWLVIFHTVRPAFNPEMPTKTEVHMLRPTV